MSIISIMCVLAGIIALPTAFAILWILIGPNHLLDVRNSIREAGLAPNGDFLRCNPMRVACWVYYPQVWLEWLRGDRYGRRRRTKFRNLCKMSYFITLFFIWGYFIFSVATSLRCVAVALWRQL